MPDTHRVYSPGLGRFVEVDVLEPAGMPAPTLRRHARGTQFALITHAEAVAGFTGMRCRKALVWYALLYRAWAEKNDTVCLPTALLQFWGVKRKTRVQALAQLERAGLITVARHPGRAPLVTLVKK